MGVINTDHRGSGGAITLSSDGTSLLLDGTAVGGGGGGLDLFVENYDGSSTLPTATGSNSITVGANAASSGTDSIALGRYVTASGFRSTALGRYTTASGQSSTAIGSNALSAETSTIAIGFSRAGDASNAMAINIANNTASYGATGLQSTATSYLAKATGNNSIAIGNTCVASSSYSHAIGIGAQASGTGSWATGLRTDTNGVIGKHVWSGVALSGNNDGSTQTGTTVLAIATTDATATALTTSADTADATNQLIVNNNSAYAFTGTIVARQKASEGTASAAWKVEGLIRREANAGTTVLVNSATTVLDNTPAWGMALTADTTNGCLKIAATGAAATNIRWVATINTSEVLYA